MQRLTGQDIVYLMVVNMPTEEEMEQAKAEMEEVARQEKENKKTAKAAAAKK